MVCGVYGMAWGRLATLGSKDGSMKHREKLTVMMCKLAFCEADETGCRSRKCDSPGWGVQSHGQFVSQHGRCPAQCKNPDFAAGEDPREPEPEPVDPRQMEFPFAESV
jgi:hypothetical protein